jgi:hypothetical protein
MIQQNKDELQHEMRKLKEILSQEFEYRRSQLESSYLSKEQNLIALLE